MAYADGLRTADHYTREQLADLIEGIFDTTYEDVVATWTPTIGSSGGSLSGVAVPYARRVVVGNFCLGQIRFTFTVTGTPGYLTFTLPYTNANSIVMVHANVLDNGVSDDYASSFTNGADGIVRVYSDGARGAWSAGLGTVNAHFFFETT